MKKIFGPILLLLLISCNEQKSINFELPSVINSGMVLQRNTDINLWGKAAPGKKIEVTTSWGVRKKTRTDKEGEWNVTVKTGEAGGPCEIAFQTKDTSVILNDILIGEVWLCSGQSNMEMPLTGWPPLDTINKSAKEIASADYPMIRIFTVARNVSAEPLDNCKGTWVKCTPETVPGFSATAYFFGKDIYRKLNIPVGLIHSSWGGTPAEAWTSKKYLDEFPGYMNIVDSFIYAEREYDTLLAWVKKLRNVPIDNNNDDFYKSLDYSDSLLVSADYDDAGWPVMTIPSLWESSALPDFDGVVIFRTRFTVPASFAGSECVLHLGPIDDMDVTYINGREIGRKMVPGMWKADRDYSIPAGLLKAGENSVAVRVVDIMGGGGIYGSDPVALTCKSGKPFILDGEWHYMPVAEIIGSTMYFYDETNNWNSRPSVTFMIGSSTPTALYNAMINPLVPFTIRGAIWYQGEANVGRGFEYRKLFPDMIASWRNAWGEGNFPFYYVQIAPWEYGDDVPSPAAELREAQLMTLSVPNTGMVVTTDIGNPVNIHPSNKQEVGRRLALWALANDYGFDTITCCGPLYDTISRENGKIFVHFNCTDGGLTAHGGPLTYFEVAGADQVFYPARAAIVGNTVEVSSDKVPEPEAVRFGWSATAEPNLFNKAGLPASPFRSDNWKRLSE